MRYQQSKKTYIFIKSHDIFLAAFFVNGLERLVEPFNVSN